MSGLDGMQNEDIYHRARALVYRCCKDLGHTLNKNHMRQGLHYVCDDAQVKDLVKAFESQEGGTSNQKAVIWIHVRSPLDLSPLIESEVSNKMKVVYFVTGGSEDSSDTVEGVITYIRQKYEMKESDIKERRRKHQLGPEVSGIELSDNGVAFSLSLSGIENSKVSKKKIQMTLAKEVANAKTNDQALNMFKDQELTCYEDDDGALHVHVNVRDVKQLVRAFSVVHFDRNRLGLSDLKLNCCKVKNALGTFSRCMLKLETLTGKQKELLKKWIRQEKKYKYTRIEGQAGTGKSYLALHILQEFMKDDSKKRECALFICRNAELAHSFASWLCNRLANDKEDRDRVLERLYFMFEERKEAQEKTDTSIYRMYDDGQEALNYEEVESPANGFSLMVADEAHHIFGSDGAPGIFKLVKDLIFRNVNDNDDIFLSKVKDTLERNEDNARILLLTDDSQGTRKDILYPDGYEVLSLNEVVRSCRKVLLTSQHYKRLNQDKT
jgi:hypothetical protein